MNITIKSLISDLEEWVRNNSDIAPLARNILNKYRDELPSVEYSLARLLDEKYQTIVTNGMQNVGYGDKEKYIFGELVRSVPFFDLRMIDLSKEKDGVGNDIYFFTVEADNSGSEVKARVECKFYLCFLNLNESERSKTGANRVFPFVVAFSLTIGEKSPFSLNLIDVRDGCGVA